MTARYQLTLQAKHDLTAIAEHIANQGGSTSAELVMEEFRETFLLLARQPGMGHAREDLTPDPALRFWPVFSYIVAYAPDERPLGIVSIVHGARDPAVIERRLRRVRPSGEQ